MKTPAARSRSAISLSWKVTLMVCLGCFLITTVPGCGGCRKEDDKEAAEKKKEEEKKKKKPDFEIQVMRSQPGNDLTRTWVKPGHWVTTSQLMRANNFDFSGQLNTAATDGRFPIKVPNTPYSMTMSRLASLPKEQTKQFDSIFFIPRGEQKENQRITLKSTLRSRSGREIGGGLPRPVKIMPDYQYFFLVLSGSPDRYGYLKRLDSVTAPWSSEFDETNLLYYQVSLPNISRRVPLPSQPMTWSALAYILWDDVDPARLTTEQQRSLLDWLHWGGQLIISGPNSLDQLKGSFLADYLPAEKVKSAEFDKQALTELNSHWSFADRKKNPRTLNVLETKPLVGVELKKHPRAELLPRTGGLAIERRIGRGRIVVTAFSLTSPQVVNWPSFDGFFNACLLRRPTREFAKPTGTFDPQVRWAQHPGLVRDARMVSTLRYFSRDIGHPSEQTPENVTVPWNEFQDEEDVVDPFAQMNNLYVEEPPQKILTRSQMDPKTDAWHFGGYRPWAQSGVAGWNDNSGAASAARTSLSDAAGITIPPPTFVLRMLAIYLVVLVPVNWTLFRTIRRVEWAWVAAPVIAIVGAFIVIEAAEVNIGFARSRTEIIVLEGYGGYSRGHVTRYTALYTSLSTPYELTFDDDTALVQPLATSEESRGRIERASAEVHFHRGKQPRLTGFRVNSNSTDMLHSEHMIDLGKGIQLDGDRQRGFVLNNQSELTINDVGLLQRKADGKLAVAWVGKIDAGASVPVTFSVIEKGDVRLKQWDDSVVMSSAKSQVDRMMRRYHFDKDDKLSRRELKSETTLLAQFAQWDTDDNGALDREELTRWWQRQRAGKFSLGSLVDLASQRLLLARGEIRMIGWSDQAVPGVTIRPLAAQTKYRTLVLMHLRGGQLPTPQRDINCFADFVAAKKTIDEDDIDSTPTLPTPKNEPQE